MSYSTRFASASRPIFTFTTTSSSRCRGSGSGWGLPHPRSWRAVSNGSSLAPATRVLGARPRRGRLAFVGGRPGPPVGVAPPALLEGRQQRQLLGPGNRVAAARLQPGQFAFVGVRRGVPARTGAQQVGGDQQIEVGQCAVAVGQVPVDVLRVPDVHVGDPVDPVLTVHPVLTLEQQVPAVHHSPLLPSSFPSRFQLRPPDSVSPGYGSLPGVSSLICHPGIPAKRGSMASSCIRGGLVTRTVYSRLGASLSSCSQYTGKPRSCSIRIRRSSRIGRMPTPLRYRPISIVRPVCTSLIDDPPVVMVQGSPTFRLFRSRRPLFTRPGSASTSRRGSASTTGSCCRPSRPVPP